MNVALSLPLALALALPPEASVNALAPDAPASAVADAARAAEKAAGARVGVSVLHLESGRTEAHRGGEPFQMASVFKLPVAIAVLDAVEHGRLTLEREVEIRKSDRRTYGPLDDAWKPGMRVTVARMVDVMLVASDNTAADKLCALLGGPSSVGKLLRAKGVAGVDVTLDEKGMAALQKKDAVALERGDLNGATPDAMTRLLVRLFRGELLSRASTDRILDAMRRCTTSDRRLRAGLPPGTEVRDKTGTVGSCANDAGIVSLPDGTHVVVAVFVRGGADAAARERAIAAMARAAWGAFASGGQRAGGRGGTSVLVSVSVAAASSR